MSLVDSIVRKFEVAINPEKVAANDATIERTRVNPEDLFRRGHWENPAGKKMRIDRGSGTVTRYPEETVMMDFDDPKVQQNLQEELESGGFTFVPATTPESEAAPLPEEVAAPEAGIQVDLLEQSQQADETIERITDKIAEDVEVIEETITEAQEIVDTGGLPALQPVLVELKGNVEATIREVSTISEEDDAADEEIASSGGAMKAIHVKEKEGRVAQLHILADEIVRLKNEVVAALGAARKLLEEKEWKVAPVVRRAKKNGTKGSAGAAQSDFVAADEKKGERVRTARRIPRSDRVFEEGGLPPAPTGRGARVTKREAKEPDDATPREENTAEVNPRQALEDFLQRPDGERILDTYWDLMKGEWQRFCDIMDASKQRRTLDEVLDIWESDERLFPKLRERLLTDMTTKRAVTQAEAEMILFAFFDDLHQDFLNHQGE